MKLFIASIFLCVSLSSFARVLCDYRFNENLGMTLQLDTYLSRPQEGTLEWDDFNSCTQDEQGQTSCTEVEIASYKVNFRELAPHSEDAVIFKLRVAARDTYGNRLARNGALKRFAKEAVFALVVTPAPKLSFRFKGRKHLMECVELND